jgi:hypothetical protein
VAGHGSLRRAAEDMVETTYNVERLVRREWIVCEIEAGEAPSPE